MTEREPTLYADERGVWREDTPGRPFGFEWSAIVEVLGYKLDAVTEVYTVVDLLEETGHCLELFHHWRGFKEVMDALGARLPGLRPTWFAEIAQLGVADPALEVWQREPESSP
jgi:hypothetical protein